MWATDTNRHLVICGDGGDSFDGTPRLCHSVRPGLPRVPLQAGAHIRAEADQCWWMHYKPTHFVSSSDYPKNWRKSLQRQQLQPFLRCEFRLTCRLL